MTSCQAELFGHEADFAWRSRQIKYQVNSPHECSGEAGRDRQMACREILVFELCTRSHGYVPTLILYLNFGVSCFFGCTFQAQLWKAFALSTAIMCSLERPPEAGVSSLVFVFNKSNQKRENKKTKKQKKRTCISNNWRFFSCLYIDCTWCLLWFQAIDQELQRLAWLWPSELHGP